MHKPIPFQNLSLSFSDKICFEDFTTQIHCGNKIGIIGRNGSGKSSLLHIILKQLIATKLIVEYVPQIIEKFDERSGGEQLLKSLTQSLQSNPDILLLDEPTNHLDAHNRKNLLQKLKYFPGTMIVVSHDQDLLQNITDIIWHINNKKIHIFTGLYADYMTELKAKHIALQNQINHLNKQKESAHLQLMQEQKRAAKSRDTGAKNIKQRKWPTIVSNAKASRSESTSGRKKQLINNTKQNIIDQLQDINLPKVIVPKFSITPKDIGNQNILNISNGKIGYSPECILLKDIYFTLNANERVAITGRNGSGKSTFLKAILNEPNIIKNGDWQLLSSDNIGYLDQKYENLNKDKTVLKAIMEIAPTWLLAQIRHHLHYFLFNTNEEVNTLIKHLSGGEKARLSLSLIAAKTPKLLLLDEVTNNLDMETRQHVVQVLKEYPGALIVISHDQSFLNEINIDREYDIEGLMIK